MISHTKDQPRTGDCWVSYRQAIDPEHKTCPRLPKVASGVGCITQHVACHQQQRIPVGNDMNRPANVSVTYHLVIYRQVHKQADRSL
jgi:hypothetical protein